MELTAQNLHVLTWNWLLPDTCCLKSVLLHRKYYNQCTLNQWTHTFPLSVIPTCLPGDLYLSEEKSRVTLKSTSIFLALLYRLSFSPRLLHSQSWTFHSDKLSIRLQGEAQNTIVRWVGTLEGPYLCNTELEIIDERERRNAICISRCPVTDFIQLIIYWPCTSRP